MLPVGELDGMGTLADTFSLMQMVAPKLMAEDSANNYLQGSGADENSPAESLENTPTAAETEALQGPFLRISVSDTSQQPVRHPEPQALPSPQPPRVCMTRLQSQEHQLLPQFQLTLLQWQHGHPFLACSFCSLHSKTATYTHTNQC